jgi:hypothetical protein
MKPVWRKLNLLCCVLSLTLIPFWLVGMIVWASTRGVPEWQIKIVERLKTAEPTYVSQNARGLFGRPIISELTLNNGSVISASDLAVLRGLRGLRALTIYSSPASDDVLKQVCELRSLKKLALNTRKEYMRLNALEMLNADTEVPQSVFSNGALARLDNLKHLTSLELTGVVITDQQMRYLAGLKDLEHVSLRNARLSLRGLRTLAELHKLRVLLVGTVEDESAAKRELQRELRDCEIFVRRWK